MAECGCKIKKVYGLHGADTLLDSETIEYCPLHAAAEKLRDALADTNASFKAVLAGKPQRNVDEIIVHNDLLLAAAKGEKP